MYLMIRNLGVADFKALTLLGVSTTRNSGNSDQIGVFGSGFVHAISLLLRNSIRPVVCTDKTKMEFFSKPEFITNSTFNRVCVKFSGGKTGVNDLGFTEEWGVQDWAKLSMALREFTANAIDGAIDNGQSYLDVEMSVVDSPRCKEGYTAVYLPYTQAIQEAHKSIGKTFLHFSRPEDIHNKFLRRDEGDDSLMIYKKGVLVAVLKDKHSVYHYNLGEELSLDESRNASLWDVNWAVAGAYKNISEEKLSEVLRRVNEGGILYESTLNLRTVENEVHKVSIKKAWEMAFGDKAVVVRSPLMLSTITNKGMNPIVMSESWVKYLESAGVPSDIKVLTQNEQAGRTVEEPSDIILNEVKRVWNWWEKLGRTVGKPFPDVKQYYSHMDGGSVSYGFYENGTVYFKNDLTGPELTQTVVEELGHYVTGAADCCRDFQTFFINLVSLLTPGDV